MSDAVPQVEEKTEAPVEEAPASRKTVRIVGMILIIFAVVLGWLLLVGYLGYQSGQQQMMTMQQEEFEAQMERQIVLAQENIDLGNVELAQVRLAWLLERDPNNQEVLQLQETIEQAQTVLVTAVPTSAQAEIVNNPTVEPSPTPGEIASPEEELQRIRRQIVRKEWAEAVSALVAFQMQFPSFERFETDKLLFEAYLGYSEVLLAGDGDQVEFGLYYLDRAESLGTLPQSMIDYRTWAELYTQGISFYGANWDVAAYYFRDLCLAAPFYQDSCSKLNEALVGFGDQYAAVQDWCPAQRSYEEARQQTSDTALAEKLDIARTGCLSATPTPTGPITGTVPVTGTFPLTGTELLPGGSFILPSPTP